MARTASQNDVYLALLAGRAVTGLARLAESPDLWNTQILKDLESGISFCDALVVRSAAPSAPIEEQQFGAILKRLSAELVEMQTGNLVSSEEIVATGTYLRGLVAKTCVPVRNEISDAMNFFLKATSGHTVKTSDEAALF